MRYGDSPENNINFQTEEFDNREDQSDTRDGDDTSLNSSYEIVFDDDSQFNISAMWVDTERTEDERSFEYNDPTATNNDIVNGGNLETDNANVKYIDQTNYNINTAYEFPLLSGTSKFKFGFARFEESVYEEEVELDTSELPMVFEEEQTKSEIDDKEWTLQWQHSQPWGDSKEIQLGAFLQNKNATVKFLESQNELELALTSWDQYAASPLTLAAFNSEYEAVTGGVNTLEEDRFDLFALIKHKDDLFAWELGIRWESTDSKINDKTIGVTENNNYDFILPSAHFRYNVSENGRISASIARSLRRPEFDF
ncbi:TonB-dependent receptor [Pseudoalteromonas sp. B193]